MEQDNKMDLEKKIEQDNQMEQDKDTTIGQLIYDGIGDKIFNLNTLEIPPRGTLGKEDLVMFLKLREQQGFWVPDILYQPEVDIFILERHLYDFIGSSALLNPEFQEALRQSIKK